MRRKSEWRFGALSGVMAALWLALALCGASPQLHHVLHVESESPEHSCVIEYISQGEVLFAPEGAVAFTAAAVSFSFHESPSAIWPARDFRVAFSRGPPSLPANRTVAG